MRRIAVLTSGGDAPGMNAAIRAVVRAAVASGQEVLGVQHGYTGLIAGDFRRLQPRDVGGIIDRGGTVLGTTRCEALKSPAGQSDALRRMQEHAIDALVVIGGNGSQSGAAALTRLGARVVGVASTIDNDLVGTDMSIGATTALDIAVQAIDRLRVTAASHKRAFLVEVMGRDTGFLALLAGVAGGAEAIVLPEAELSPEALAQEIRSAYARGKSHAIVVVAEGARHNAEGMAQYFREHAERLGFDLRITRLGHIQRGGAPGVFDRIMATRLGAAAVGELNRNGHGVLLGILDGRVTASPYAQVVNAVKAFDRELFELAGVLAR
jgi:6-phosphofructokinase 1